MLTIIKIAFLNIWRTPLRSSVVIFSIALGIWAGLFVIAFCYGINHQRTSETIKSSISHLQIHNPKFKKDYNNKFNLKEHNKIVKFISEIKQIKSFCKRTLSLGMISSTINSNGVKIIGIEPSKEILVTSISKKVIEGDFFEKMKKNSILIGDALAKKLNVKLKSKVVVTFQNSNNEIISGAFRICGIFKTQYTKYDEQNIFLLSEDFQRISNDNSFHEIAILLTDINELNHIENKLKTNLNECLIENWKNLAPELAYADEVMETWLFLIMIIIMLALIFGIINTMLMAVFERRRELGMLMAIGMNKFKIFTLILYETFILSLIGGPFGMILAYMTIYLTSKNGINLSIFKNGLESVGLSSTIYPKIDTNYYIYITLLVLVFTLFSSIFPSKKALKLKPTEAIKTI